MNVPSRLGLFGAAAALVFAGSAALGAAFGPEPTPTDRPNVPVHPSDTRTPVTTHGGHS
jgi:hypothetical protein